jgi:hypothetical protein
MNNVSLLPNIYAPINSVTIFSFCHLTASKIEAINPSNPNQIINRVFELVEYREGSSVLGFALEFHLFDTSTNERFCRNRDREFTSISEAHDAFNSWIEAEGASLSDFFQLAA